MRRQQGMTLLEVMVALMIFAIGCLALINSTGGQVRSLSEIEAKTVALWVADNQLTLLQLDPQPPTLAWHSGTTVMAGETWHWRYRGQETSDAGMRAIAIEVRRDPQDRNVLAELQAYRGGAMKRALQRGFTLVEMLLAIALFAMLSLTALAVFRGVLKNDEITQRKSTQLTQLQRALAIVERDFAHAQARAPIGDKRRPAAPEFAVLQTAEGEDVDFQLLLIRSGWSNPQARLPRATQERVAYRHRQGRLERLSYPNLSSPQATARSVLLLPEVTRFRLRFYRQGEWLTAWRAGGLLPQAVEITVETPALGEIRRIIALPSARP